MSIRLRPALESDYPRLVEILNSQVPLPETVEGFLRGDRMRNKEFPYLRLVAEAADGTIVGFGGTSRGPVNRPGEFGIRVRVETPYWGRGFGSALYNALDQYAREHGVTRYETGLRDNDPRSYEWAQRRGFAKEHHLFESELDLQAWDPAPMLAVVAAAEQSGVRFTTLAAEGATEANYMRLHELDNAVSKDVPGNSDRPAFPYAEFMKWVNEDPAFDPARTFLAAEGDQWGALAIVLRRDDGTLYNGFTGVSRAFRGRGIALALKTHALVECKKAGAARIRTNNHSSNGPMLAVNRKLGYQPLPGHFLMAKKVGE